MPRDSADTTHWPNGRARGVQRLSAAHVALADALIADPSVSHIELAARFEYTAGWIGQVLASEAFQSTLAARRRELVDPALKASIEQQIGGVMQRALEIIREQLAKPSAEVPAAVALRAFEVSSKAAGYGSGPPPAAPKVEVNVVAHLEQLAGNLESLLKRRKAETNAIDATAEADSGVPPSASRGAAKLVVTSSD